MATPKAPAATPTEAPPTTDSNSKDSVQKTSRKFALNETNVFKAYEDADTYTQLLNDPFPEYSRIARNKPYPGLAKKFPKIAEGSTASYIQQKPRSLIQKTPGGNVTADGGAEWLGLIAQWALDFEIIPYATEDYPVFEKAQYALEQAYTVGFTCTTAPFYNHGGVWTPDMQMAYWADVIEPSGYKSIKASPYTFLRGWWPEERIDQILADPVAAAKGGWNVANLKQVKTNLAAKDDKSETPAEKQRGLPQNYVVVVNGYQKGVKAPIFTFSPDPKLILRTKANPDPRGHKNIQTLYGGVDGTNPFGRSVIDLVGAWQNLMDNDAQAYQYNRAYNVDPAIRKIGDIGDGDLHPGAEFEVDEGSEANIETIELSSSSLENYPTLYEWQRSVLLNMLNSPTSAGADANDSPLGKTPKGIATAAGQISTDDLTMITHVHDWFQEWAETAVNIYFAERKGKQSLELDPTTADQLRAMAENDPESFNISMLKGDTLTFNFDAKLPIFRFKVDASSSKVQDENTQIQSLEGILSLVKEYPQLEQLIGEEKIAQIYNKIVALSGIHDESELTIDIAALKKQMEEQQQSQNSNESEQERIAESAKAPSVSMAFKDLPGYGKLQVAKMYAVTLRPQDVGLGPDLSPQPQVPGAPSTPPVPNTAQPTPANVANPPSNPQVPAELIQAITTLKKSGLPEVLIPHAIQALTEGIPLEDILKSVTHPDVAQFAAQQPPQPPEGAPNGS